MQKEWSGMCKIDILSTEKLYKEEISPAFSQAAAAQVKNFHKQLAAYQETPLVQLSALAGELGVKNIFVKDESERFSLRAFKGLGGSYAMFRILCQRLGYDPCKTSLKDLQTETAQKEISKAVFVTATDGNHGKGVSWAGGLFGCQVRVYMPAGSAEVRAEAIRKAGPAEVTITQMNYDETVQYAMQQSKEQGWYLIQDTAWDGYEEIPAFIIEGYLTMASEAVDQMNAAGQTPTHVFLQAGVGAMAGGVLAYLSNCFGSKKPVVTIVEPSVVNCIYRSAKAGDKKAHRVEGNPATIMAGLNCGTPCKITWPILRDYAEFYMACPDYVAAQGMRIYARPKLNDKKIVSGESGAATVGALWMLLSQNELIQAKEAMGLNADSVILLFNTEGDTDPQGYDNIVVKNYYPLPDNINQTKI